MARILAKSAVIGGLLLVVLIGYVLRSAASDGTQKTTNPLGGISQVSVLVEDIGTIGSGIRGLNRDNIVRVVKQRLQHHDMPIVKDGEPILYVQLIAGKPGVCSECVGCVADISIRLMKYTALPSGALADLVIWEQQEFMVNEQNNCVNNVHNVINEMVDDFSLAYQAANPRRRRAASRAALGRDQPDRRLQRSSAEGDRNRGDNP